MNAATILARESPRASANRTAQAIARFAEPHRPAILRLASRHPRLADLAISFPALLFALAVPRRRFDPQPAIARVIAGASLAELAALTGIPIWTRKLHPRGFKAPIPILPDSFKIRRQIANHLPHCPRTTGMWLHAVGFAARWCSDDLAIWYARNADKPNWSSAVAGIPLISAWAWHCAHPEAPAAAMLHGRWTPDMAAMPAIEAAMRWKAGVLSLLYLTSMEQPEPWAESATVDGHRFTPALTVPAIAEAADKLSNCARDRGVGVARGRSQTWLVSREDKLIAMLELGNNTVVQISQIAGPRNTPVSAETALAAHRWFVRHSEPRLVLEQQYASIRQAWIRVWRPYWLAVRRLPSWLPFSPPRNRSRWLPGPWEGPRQTRTRRSRRRRA